ncbi:MAG TPA: DoxX family protein [Burkholderiales bacterium]|jgi:putative oxidoreductase|nr:DoxX family protein [Burkholderiales bacterium]
MNHSAMLVGRILLSLVFLIAGYRKLMGVAASAGYFAKLGFPMPEVLVWVAIAVELGGAILLIVGWKTRWAALLLALFTLIATFAAHRFWEVDPAQYANQMNHFLKNLAIVGGMVILAATGPGALSVDGRRRS